MNLNKNQKNLLKAVTFLGIAFSMMGNQSCQQEQIQKIRVPKRQVQISQLEVPELRLPDGGQFDFANAAKQQLPDIIMKSNGFTTAGIDPSKVYDTAGLGPANDEEFRQCSLLEDQNQDQAGLMAKSVRTEISACMINLPHGKLYGSIYDFSLISRNGMSLGLSQIPSMSAINGSFNFNTQKSELSVALRAEHLLMKGGSVNNGSDKLVLATTNQSSYAKDWGAGISVGFSFLQLGGNTYRKSNLARVVEEGLSQALEDLRKEWDKHEPWFGMIVKNCDRAVFINAGSAAGSNLKVGDIIRIQNVTYEWAGAACASELKSYIDSGVVNGAAPVAYARVTTVGTNMTAAVIITKDPNYPQDLNQVIKPGARAYIEKLAEEIESQSGQVAKK